MRLMSSRPQVYALLWFVRQERTSRGGADVARFKDMSREVARAVIEHGAALFDTEDLQSGVVTLLKEGPGKGSFSGK